MLGLLERSILEYEDALDEFEIEQEYKALTNLHRAVRDLYLLAPEKHPIISQIEEDFKKIKVEKSGEVNDREKHKIVSISKNVGILISDIKKSDFPKYIKDLEIRARSSEEQVKEKDKVITDLREELKKLKEGVSGIPMYTEKDLLIETLMTAYSIRIRKEKVSTFSPRLEQLGNHIRASGNPKNAGSDLLTIHSAIENERASRGLDINELIGYKPRLFIPLSEELERIFEFLIKHYQTELGEI